MCSPDDYPVTMGCFFFSFAVECFCLGLKHVNILFGINNLHFSGLLATVISLQENSLFLTKDGLYQLGEDTGRFSGK